MVKISNTPVISMQEKRFPSTNGNTCKAKTQLGVGFLDAQLSTATHGPFCGPGNEATARVHA